MVFETLVAMYVILWIIPCMIIASAKNKNVGNAFIGSLLFGFFALLYYVFARSEEPKKPTDEKNTFTCGNCGAEVSEDADFCPKCGTKFEKNGIKCPKCKTSNSKDNAFCLKCGYKLIDEPNPEYTCEYCDRKFKNENLLKVHYKSCKIRKQKKAKGDKIAFLAISILITAIISLIFLIINPINIIPTLLIFFVITPYFNIVFDKYKHKQSKLKNQDLNWWKKGIIIIIIILLFVGINLITPNCPKSCDDFDSCTNDFCSSETGYKCMNTVKLNCNGNKICESGEYGTSTDCPICDDKNKCTADSYDAVSNQCLHVDMKGCVN